MEPQSKPPLHAPMHPPKPKPGFKGMSPGPTTQQINKCKMCSSRQVEGLGFLKCPRRCVGTGQKGRQGKGKEGQGPPVGKGAQREGVGRTGGRQVKAKAWEGGRQRLCGQGGGSTKGKIRVRFIDISMVYTRQENIYREGHKQGKEGRGRKVEEV